MGMFAVKNDKGEWLYSDEYNDWVDQLYLASFYDTFEDADDDIECRGLSNAYVVELAEAHAKVVLTEKQAEIVEEAHVSDIPASYISGHSDVYNGEEILLINAYVNGYTVEKEKKYLVKVPKKWSGDDKHYWMKRQDGSLMWVYYKDYMIPAQQFTEAEIEHYGLQDYEKEEVTDHE